MLSKTETALLELYTIVIAKERIWHIWQKTEGLETFIEYRNSLKDVSDATEVVDIMMRYEGRLN